MSDQIDALTTPDSPAEFEAAAEQPSPKPTVSEARLTANRANAQKSTGPRTPEGKQRSATNATRHSILAQVMVMPEEELAVYKKFTKDYADSLSPANVVEQQLAHSCADLQFRLNRLAAAEHNLFTIGFEQHADLHSVQQTESHVALTAAETIIHSKDPLATLSIYEQRLHRRLLQTLKQLKTMQDDRREHEKEELAEMRNIGLRDAEQAEDLDPADFGFVCSIRTWQYFWHRKRFTNPWLTPPASPKKSPGNRPKAA